MEKIVNGELYLDTAGAMELLETPKKRFYSNARPSLEAYFFDAKRTPWYKQKDVMDLKIGKVVRKASISISGIQRDWTTYLLSLGYHAQTIDRTIETTTLPEDAVTFFRLPADELFVKRSRMTLVDSTPICAWASYYPLKLVEGDILQEMKHGSSVDVPNLIRKKHGIIVRMAKDKYRARTASFEEQELLRLTTNEPVLILQRASYSKDRQPVLFSDMVLLGAWFAPEHEYEVDIWEE